MGKKSGEKIRITRLVYGIFREALFLCLLFVAGGVMGFALVYFFRVPSADDLFEHKLAQTSIIYDRTGARVLYEIHGEENRKLLPHDAIPDVVRHATIAAEDDAFYRHFGFDPLSIGRAFMRNIEEGSIVQGGSTITQQVARIFYLDRERSFVRKLNEIVLAFKIDRKYEKDDILDLYLNTIPYGSNAYGIQAAAEVFFDKDAIDLTVDEAAFLAALPKATTTLSPYRDPNKALADRQRQIILRMAEIGLIDEPTRRQAVAADTFAKVQPRRDPILAPHFVFSVLGELEERYDRTTLETDGLRIRTTIDLDLQEKAEASVERGVERNRSRGAENAALVAVDVATGEVLAMAGSRDYFDTAIDGQVNVAIRARQPGSAFKPFVYARAFEEGFEPETRILDAPVNFGPDGSGRDYVPQNYSGKSYGMLTMRQALSMSLNIPAVQTLAVVGVDDAIELAERLGITTLDDPKRYGLSLVLGGAEVRPLEMASAFSVFASDGIRRPPVSIRSIERDGREIYGVLDHDPEERVLDEQVARRINSILSDNVARTPVFGPASPLAFPDGSAAAKTGTTQGFRDAWTVGYTSRLSVAVWAGNNDNRPMAAGADGVFVAAPIWRDFIDQAPEYRTGPFIAYEPRTADDTRLIAGGTLTTYDKERFEPEKEKKSKKGGKKKKTKKG